MGFAKGFSQKKRPSSNEDGQAIGSGNYDSMRISNKLFYLKILFFSNNDFDTKLVESLNIFIRNSRVCH